MNRILIVLLAMAGLAAQDTCLDLAGQANMGFRDEVAGDGIGGWSDQGPENDLRTFDVKRQEYGGVPFRIADPAVNAGKAVLAFRGPHLGVPLADASVRLSAPVRARWLYLLHTTCWNQTKERIGTITVRSADGRTRTVEVKSGRDVADWWAAGALANGAVVYSQPNRSASVGLYLSRFDLGEDAGEVSEVAFATDASAIWIVVGATLSDRDIPLPVEQPWIAREEGRWKRIDTDHLQVVPGSALDFSALVGPGPAGQHGRARILPGGDLEFPGQPGRPVRLFGFQVLVNHLFRGPDCRLADKDDEEKTRANIRTWAALVRRHGYNMVRLQAIDLFLMEGAKADLEFNPRNHERLDYLVAQLKEAGVYVGVDINSFIGFHAVGWEEGLARRYGERFLVDEQARQTWRTGMERLMTRVNPHTGLTLANDPAVVFATCFNEQDIPPCRDGTFDAPWLRPHAERRWRAFLAERYRADSAALRRVWGVDDSAAAPMYTREQLFGGGERGSDACRFLFELEDGMTAWYLEGLAAVGYPGLAVQFDVISQYLHHAVHARTNAVANHGYHAHPSDYSKPGSRCQQDGSVAGAAGYFRSRLAARLVDRPYLVTEYSTPYWHRYRHEEGLVYPAYASLQGCTAITAHECAVSLHPVALQDFYLGRDPINRANQALAALLYAGGAVARSPSQVEIVIDDDFVLSGSNAVASVDAGQARVGLLCGFGLRYQGRPRPAGVPEAPASRLALRPDGRGLVVATAFAAGTAESDGDVAGRTIAAVRSAGILPAGNRTDHAAGIYQSDTGEILMDTRAQRLAVTTARACGAVVKPGQTADAGDLTAIASDVAATIAVGSLDGRPLADSRRMLLVYSTDAVNTGHETSADRVVLRKLGVLPVLIETGAMRAELRNASAAALRCHALTLDGTRCGEVPLTAADGRLRIAIDTARLPGGPALFFELTAD